MFLIDVLFREIILLSNL